MQYTYYIKEGPWSDNDTCRPSEIHCMFINWDIFKFQVNSILAF